MKDCTIDEAKKNTNILVFISFFIQISAYFQRICNIFLDISRILSLKLYAYQHLESSYLCNLINKHM